ncbi:hypothetical protein [Nocardioides sp.]|uniref:hypothetical protein n=1 Tax=Nocardioides sp. TaxID=35761 RepID=UPI002620AB58|nr:hypothetical protein [Nocardioides sp.]MDI6911466.1 hypothetical protein [Nocardioides sp.]
MTTENVRVFAATRSKGPCAHTWVEGSKVCSICGAALTFEDDSDGLIDDLIEALEQRLGEVAYDGLRAVIDHVPEAERRAHLMEARKRVLRDLGLGVISSTGAQS